MALDIRSSFNPDLTTVLPREGIDIGPAPDFWGDLDRIQRRLKPNAQAQALGGGGRSRPMLSAAPRTQGPARRQVPFYVLPSNVGAGSTFYQPWSPGMGLGPNQHPVFAGYRDEEEEAGGRRG